MSVLDTLVTDRTGPGPYDWHDFNRVQAAVDELVDLFAAYGYQVPVVRLPEWSRKDVAFASQCAAYLANVRALRETLATLPTTPPCPENMSGWSWESANDLEQILADLEVVLTALSKTKVRCAQTVLFCGNVYYMREPERALVDRTGAMVRTRDGRGIILRQN